MIDGNMPYLLPFNYGYYENCIYIHSAPSGKKIEVLRTNPEVCFEIEEQAEILRDEKPCSWSTLYRSAIGYGTIDFIEDSAEKQEALKIIMRHNGFKEDIHFEKGKTELTCIFRIKIKSLTGKQSSNWNKVYEGQKYNLETPRLELKEANWPDLEQIHRHHLIPEVAEFNTIGIPENIEITREIIRPSIEDKKNEIRRFISWTINLKENSKFIGEAGMILSANRFKLGEIYYNLNPTYWGNGYGTETAKALINFGFQRFRLHIIEAGVATGNTRSIRVLEKSGMTREGLRRKILPIRGEWKDNYHYAILETDERDY